MTLKNAINHFNLLVSETRKKSEIKVYQNFIHILTSLEKRNLTETEVHSIETELDALHLNSIPRNKKRYFNKALKQFKIYLKNTFSFITKGYYTMWGIALGSYFGLAFGIVFLSGMERSLGLSLGISIGTLIGIIMGNYLESQAKASGKLI